MEQSQSAGDFSSWLDAMQAAIRGEEDADVPCGSCAACCTSSQFVHIAPDETDTLSHIPPALLFPAPRMPRGHVLLGYDERGHCPMLTDGRCSIYAHRPRTCRTYDCRVFPASGLEPEDEQKVLIAQQARRWRYSYSSEAAHAEHDAVRAAATFLEERTDVLPDGTVPADTTQRAVLAIEIHDAFLRRQDEGDQTEVVDPDPNVVRVEVLRRTGGVRA